jgi:hypothetical protein
MKIEINYPAYRIDQPLYQQILFHLMDWPEDQHLAGFNARLRVLVVLFYKRIGLTYWPQRGTMPEGVTARGWYEQKPDGTWDLLLSDDTYVTAVTLGGVNIWLEGAKTKAVVTPEAYIWDQKPTKKNKNHIKRANDHFPEVLPSEAINHPTELQTPEIGGNLEAKNGTAAEAAPPRPLKRKAKRSEVKK